MYRFPDIYRLWPLLRLFTDIITRFNFGLLSTKLITNVFRLAYVYPRDMHSRKPAVAENLIRGIQYASNK